MTGDNNRPSSSVVSAPRQAEGGAGPRAELVPGRSWSPAARLGARLQEVPPPDPPPPSGGVGGLSIPDADATRRRGRLRDGAGAIAPACRGVPSTPRAAPFQPRGTQPFRVQSWAEDEVD